MKKNIFPLSKCFLCTTCLILYTFFSFSQPVIFNYTGASQTYTIGACVYTLTVDVKGAEGAIAQSGGAAPGGKGGRVQATIPVIPGEILNIYVGQQAPAEPGGWNGGGSAAAAGAGGGGGASDIRQGGTLLSHRVVVGSGGGGGGGTGAGYNGGNGGGLTGVDGASSSWGGKGGTQTNGGAGGTYSWNINGSPGSLGNGGNGAGARGGGGGGGYYGGGGGTDATTAGGGGGGGSSYAVSAATSVTHTPGFQTGNGQIIITPIVSSGPPTPGTISGSVSVCAGATAIYSSSVVSSATTYSWTVPSGAVINSPQGTTSVSVTFGSSSGTISVTASNSCGTSAPSSKAVTVNPNPPANAGNDVTICNGQSTTLSGSGGTNYLWSTGETDATISVSPVATTNYTLVVSDANGCSGTDEVAVAVDSCIVGISSVTENTTIRISPNPTKGEFAIYNLQSNIYDLEIYDMMGVKIQNLATGNMQLENNNMTFME